MKKVTKGTLALALIGTAVTSVAESQMHCDTPAQATGRMIGSMACWFAITYVTSQVFK
jgi:uncharacterized membrane-anchored protein YjiN (DUF445 family)